MQLHAQLEKNYCASKILFLPLALSAMEGSTLRLLPSELLLQGGDSAGPPEASDLKSAFCRGTESGHLKDEVNIGQD